MKAQFRDVKWNSQPWQSERIFSKSSWRFSVSRRDPSIFESARGERLSFVKKKNATNNAYLDLFLPTRNMEFFRRSLKGMSNIPRANK
jgi:hypothetical protein